MRSVSAHEHVDALYPTNDKLNITVMSQESCTSVDPSDTLEKVFSLSGFHHHRDFPNHLVEHWHKAPLADSIHFSKALYAAATNPNPSWKLVLPVVVSPRND